MVLKVRSNLTNKKSGQNSSLCQSSTKKFKTFSNFLIFKSQTKNEIKFLVGNKYSPPSNININKKEYNHFTKLVIKYKINK
jgi:hypothetical protein